ncbi:MAG: DUF1858 domain-containing protein [Clostridiales bacterium]|jgi:hypothetical protein|nr:DUF1858 domain-containing protein [Clostridiales bacterium]
MDKKIDLKKTVFELSQLHPEFLETMKELGFHDITNPAMLKTAGRFMTVPKGARMKGIPLEKIKEAFERKGFEVIE